MARPSWDDIWMQMCDVIATRSLCSRAQVGAVVVTEDNRVQSASYNGPAPGLDVVGTCAGWCPRARPGAALDTGYMDCYALHAEANAIARADHTKLDGATVYVNGSVCWNCAKLITATRISRVVMRINEGESHRDTAGVIGYLVRCGMRVETREQ